MFYQTQLRVSKIPELYYRTGTKNKIGLKLINQKSLGGY